jgi:hypothetical protein
MTNTMTEERPPVKSKARSRKAPDRRLYHNPVQGLIVVTVGAEEFGYWYDRLRHADARAFRLTKFLTNQRPGEPAEYDVAVGPGVGSCECKGFCRHGRCKHLDAINALIERGSL